ncbi:hypothetical protein ANTQUA_LOCUS7996 [Anthophora quadrimaculata]
MYIFTVILGAVTVLCVYVAAESNEQSDVAGSHATGAKFTAPFSSVFETETSQQDNRRYNFPIDNIYKPFQNKRCPLCDSSVYPYCGEKLLHDACCCTDPYSHDLPYQCKLADCRFLHANSCKEHRLIAVCCCSDDYRSLLKSFTKT